MKLEEFLKSLTDAERDFIAALDYGNDLEKHRQEIDLVIERQGQVNFEKQLWYPYEVIELGKNWLQEGHEREFVACAGIVLQNITAGADNMNDWEINMSVLRDSWEGLQALHRKLLEPLAEQAKRMD
ncbi:MAG: hypothetical protein HRU46_18090 [Verrucomicrobiales bacterium]|nr:hypothetical protein [Verrucomicrobiales bacterium]